MGATSAEERLDVCRLQLEGLPCHSTCHTAGGTVQVAALQQRLRSIAAEGGIELSRSHAEKGRINTFKCVQAAEVCKARGLVQALLEEVVPLSFRSVSHLDPLVVSGFPAPVYDHALDAAQTLLCVRVLGIQPQHVLEVSSGLCKVSHAVVCAAPAIEGLDIMRVQCQGLAGHLARRVHGSALQANALEQQLGRAAVKQYAHRPGLRAERGHVEVVLENGDASSVRRESSLNVSRL
mmetsp:Transcript_33897/g.107658  ORF Transcript_33897/g.107658 Transcript_33897/m.107658 type:complete len:236 (+) Transcript_33897:1408-2115(+)